MQEFIESLILFFGLVTTALILVGAWAIFVTDKAEYRKNFERTEKFRNPFRGRLALGGDGARDPRVQSGLVFNRTTKKYESQYALSDEAVRAVLFPKKD